MPRNVNPHQLAMFMTPDQIKSYVTDSVDRFDSSMGSEEQTMGDVWKEKSGAAHGTGMVADVMKHGVEKPVIIDYDNGEPWMGNGHHRVASADAVQQRKGRPQFVPVIHDYDVHGTPEAKQAFPALRESWQVKR